jgi:hypothetical protein
MKVHQHSLIKSLLDNSAFITIAVEEKQKINDIFNAIMTIMESDDCVKFKLPENGVIFDTDAFSQDTTLQLPFKRIAVEYITDTGTDTVLFCEQMNDKIAIYKFFRERRITNSKAFYFVAGRVIYDRVAPRSLTPQFDKGFERDLMEKSNISNIGTVTNLLMLDPIVAIEQLLLALDCRNVTFVKEVERPITEKKKKIKGKVTPKYHNIVITPKTFKKSLSGSETMEMEERQRPEEHLRRGHIHRFKTKEGHVSYWINSIIVNPGIGKRMPKTYIVKP